MKEALARFVAWSKDHATTPCPDLAALGLDGDAGRDPWGHPIQLTCIDQPGDQMIGAISAGPDGVAGNADDIASWQLPHDITDVAHGPRWAPKPAATPTPKSTHSSTHPSTKTSHTKEDPPHAPPAAGSAKGTFDRGD
jgi:hypothetical protein